MDTLSAAAATINVPCLPPQPLRPIFSRRFKSTVNATASANLSKPASSSSSPSSYSLNKSSSFLPPISLPHQHAKPSSPPLHEKAASGFAAALVSVCQSKNCLGRTRHDARRLLEFLMGQEKKMNHNNNNNKKLFVNDVVDKPKFGKHLKGLVKLLSARGQSSILFDVLCEFDRISAELVLVHVS